MALEIERRFLVTDPGWRRHVAWEAELRQGYLVSGADGLTLRVRSSRRGAEEEAWLTLKAPPPITTTAATTPAAITTAATSAISGLERLEFEYPVPLADAAALLDLAGTELRKRRYGLDLPGGDWVLDVFEGANAPLVVAEVELERADQPLHLPPWCGTELTGRHALSNAALARRPLQAWSEAERQSLLA
jgi:CYTH domain-containing protein